MPSDPYSRRAPFPHLSRARGARGVSRWRMWARCAIPTSRRRIRRPGCFCAPTPIDIGIFLRVARSALRGPLGGGTHRRPAPVIDRAAGDHLPLTRTILETGLTASPSTPSMPSTLLQQARRHAASLFSRYDALLLPAAPFCPTLAEVAADPIGPNRRLGTFTNFANLCDLAGFAVPIGFRRRPEPDRRRAAGSCLVGGPARAARRRTAPPVRRHVGATGQTLPPPPNRTRWRRRKPRCSASARTWPGCR